MCAAWRAAASAENCQITDDEMIRGTPCRETLDGDEVNRRYHGGRAQTDEINRGYRFGFGEARIYPPTAW